MLNIDNLLALCGFAFVSSITPGPNNLMIMASGANFGLRLSLPHLFGIALGFCVMLVAVGIGVMTVFQAFPLLFELLKVASVIYLAYLSWKIATSEPVRVNSSARNTDQGSKPFTFLQASLFQWVNPKAWTMAVTAVSVYSGHSPSFETLMLVAGSFGAVNLPCVAVWLFFGARLSRYLAVPARARVFNRTAAVILLATVIPVFLAD